jgi:hypothetical protein
MLMRGMYIVGSLEYSLTDLLLSKDISILIYLKNQNKHLITEFGALILKTVKSLKKMKVSVS